MQPRRSHEASQGIDPSSSYQAPSLTVVGSVHDLTQEDKKYGPTDGFTFQGVAITNSSR